MTVNYDPMLLGDPNYALGVLCSEFYDRYGEAIAEVLRRICYQRGVALGRGLVQKGEKSFEHAVKTFEAASQKTKTPGKIISLEKNRAVLQGTACPLGLKTRGRRICEIMMTLDQGILEEASGNKIHYKVNRTLAAGDDFCEVIFEVER